MVGAHFPVLKLNVCGRATFTRRPNCRHRRGYLLLLWPHKLVDWVVHLGGVSDGATSRGWREIIVDVSSDAIVPRAWQLCPFPLFVFLVHFSRCLHRTMVFLAGILL